MRRYNFQYILLLEVYKCRKENMGYCQTGFCSSAVEKIHRWVNRAAAAWERLWGWFWWRWIEWLTSRSLSALATGSFIWVHELQSVCHRQWDRCSIGLTASSSIPMSSLAGSGQKGQRILPGKAVNMPKQDHFCWTSFLNSSLNFSTFATHDLFYSPKWLISVPAEHHGPAWVSESSTLAANIRLMLYTHTLPWRIIFFTVILEWLWQLSLQQHINLTDTDHRHICQVPFCPPGCCLHPWSSYWDSHKIFWLFVFFKSRMILN